MKIKLEYSTTQEAFHASRLSTAYPDNGYQVLGEVDEDEAAKFVYYMNKKYPIRDNLPIEIVKIEFKDFFKN